MLVKLRFHLLLSPAALKATDDLDDDNRSFVSFAQDDDLGYVRFEAALEDGREHERNVVVQFADDGLGAADFAAVLCYMSPPEQLLRISKTR